MSVRVGLRPMSRPLGAPCNPEWFSDFEADAVGAVPAGWAEVYGQFRVRDDYAKVGVHSVRLVYQAAQTLIGYRLTPCAPSTGRLQWYWRIQGAAETRTRVDVVTTVGSFVALEMIVGRTHFRYTDGTWQDVPNSPAPVSNTWYTMDVRASTLTNKWKVLINGYDSGWLNPAATGGTFAQVNAIINYNYPPTYAWWDEVRWGITI